MQHATVIPTNSRALIAKALTAAAGSGEDGIEAAGDVARALGPVFVLIPETVRRLIQVNHHRAVRGAFGARPEGLMGSVEAVLFDSSGRLEATLLRLPHWSAGMAAS